MRPEGTDGALCPWHTGAKVLPRPCPLALSPFLLPSVLTLQPLHPGSSAPLHTTLFRVKAGGPGGAWEGLGVQP